MPQLLVIRWTNISLYFILILPSIQKKMTKGVTGIMHFDDFTDFEIRGLRNNTKN